MNRRGFLKYLGIGAAAASTGAIALLEQGVWTPKRTFFLPPAGGWGGKQLLTIQSITEEALKVLEERLQFRTVRQYIINNDSLPMKVEGAYLNVCRPPRYDFHALDRIINEWSA